MRGSGAKIEGGRGKTFYLEKHTMTDSQRFYDLFRKVASLEKRISRLEDGYQELDGIVDPEGWIGEAFKLQEEDLEAIKSQISALRTEVNEVNGKLDVILTHLTGWNT
jgi:predicted  nucleic acid-binding Zn-ribbon protein